MGKNSCEGEASIYNGKYIYRGLTTDASILPWYRIYLTYLANWVFVSR